MSTKEFISIAEKADLSKVSYEEIKHLISNEKVKVPFLTSIIKKGTPIERGRLNHTVGFYNSEFDISYRTDYGNIREFGRANEPYRSRFYGAIPSNDIALTRVTLFCELDPKFNDKSLKNYSQIMTIGQWEVIEDFEVASVWFSEDYLTIKELKLQYDLWIERLKGTEMGKDENIQLLRFFSNQFSKSLINSHHDYKFSCVYSDYAIHAQGLNGVLYPSVKTKYAGFNIVLSKEAVERYLRLNKVGMFKYEVKNGKPILFPLYYSSQLGPSNMDFNWIPFKYKN